ncbi:HEAT repeat domain-containing protein [Streptomyces sp. 7N604]|uniref:HEAT repeat domain-containing protein n=1 Tax=Streptomyces sp. 7N604 TaxID=3457415 RepID=UPI003FD1429B
MSVDAIDALAGAAADTSREVRVAAAKGLGSTAARPHHLHTLVRDQDPLVRAAALEALAATGCPTRTAPPRSKRWPTCLAGPGGRRHRPVRRTTRYRDPRPGQDPRRRQRRHPKGGRPRPPPPHRPR